jgi:putative nucleotidyltransferase with HDIG domain
MTKKKTSLTLTGFLRSVRQRSAVALKIVIGLVLTVLLALMFPRGESIDLDYKVGGIWARKDLIAPFSFPIYRDEFEYAEDVTHARANTFMVFEPDTHIVQRSIENINHLFSMLDDALKLRQSYQRSTRERKPSAAEDSARFAERISRLDVSFSETEWDALSALRDRRGNDGGALRLEELERTVIAVMKEIYRVGILDRLKTTFVRPEVALRRGTQETIVPVSRLYDQNEVLKILEEDLFRAIPRDSTAVGIAYKILALHLQPNLKFNRAVTDAAIAAAVQEVPRTLGFVQENERVVSKHERITPETKLKLESFRRALVERGPESDLALQLGGTALHVALVVALFSIYLYLFRKRIFGSDRRLVLIALLILMEGFFAYLTRELNVNAPIEYLILVPAASMLLTISFDSRVGFYGTVIIAFLVAGIRGNDYSIALASLVGGALAVYTVRDVKNRTQIFRSLGFIFLGYALTIIALGMERFESTLMVAEQLTFAFANAIFSPVLTYGLLVFFERVFKITTDLTLIELSHFNHPLLRLLAERAPGTYQHSLAMASLAEAAASAVGANEVLARVGAYFHDVGKIGKPTYFVENQRTSRNRHDKLSPRMSSLIISAHVKDGVALAREYGLPQEVVDFIPQHHGTTRIEFFYNKALRLAESSQDETKIDEINELDYRYPGPKPQSKETGILMLADVVEATARTLDDPSPQKLEVVIDEIIKKRFVDGELDECPLTLKDLTNIKTAFLGVLVGIYHARVRYPDAGKAQPKTRGKTTPSEESAEGDGLSQKIREIDKQ